MKRIIILFLLFVSFSSGKCYAQDSLGIKFHHHFFAEFGGASVFGFAGNYELQMHFKNTNFLAVKAGFGKTIEIMPAGFGYPLGAIGINYNTGKKKAFWENGFSVIYSDFNIDGPHEKFLQFNSGLRIQGDKIPITARVGVNYNFFLDAEE
ncbi:MAG: hypothetical protein H7Y00_07565, partial [Fimbriimonadaceae bacterium]|nr:hypothetical protein [Chitinophagales bacterium]